MEKLLLLAPGVRHEALLWKKRKQRRKLQTLMFRREPSSPLPQCRERRLALRSREVSERSQVRQTRRWCGEGSAWPLERRASRTWKYPYAVSDITTLNAHAASLHDKVNVSESASHHA